jgi:hypothetical protein
MKPIISWDLLDPIPDAYYTVQTRREAVKKGDKRKRKKAQQKRAGRKQGARQARARGPMSVLQHIRHAREYPIEGCWAMPGWEEGGMAVVVVARRQPDGNILYGTYLVDHYCLGLKNTFFNADIPMGQFQREVLPEAVQGNEPVEISPALAHELIYGSIEYAEQYGFRPQRDYRRTRNILDPPDTHPRTGTVEFGHEGKPLFISGPYDNVDAIIRQLDRTAGEGNYHFLIGLDGSPDGEWEIDDEWDGD